MKNEKLEPKKAMQKIILDTIVAYIQKFGYPPTVREIGEIVGLKSSSSVYRHLKALEEQGFIINDGMPRAISVIGWKFVKEGEKDGTVKGDY